MRYASSSTPKPCQRRLRLIEAAVTILNVCLKRSCLSATAIIPTTSPHLYWLQKTCIHWWIITLTVNYFPVCLFRASTSQFFLTRLLSSHLSVLVSRLSPLMAPPYKEPVWHLGFRLARFPLLIVVLQIPYTQTLFLASIFGRRFKMELTSSSFFSWCFDWIAFFVSPSFRLKLLVLRKLSQQRK